MLEFIQRFTNFIARLPGLPIIIAVGLVILNLILQLLPAWPVVGWLAQTNLLLHVGLIVGFLGLLLGEVF